MPSPADFPPSFVGWLAILVLVMGHAQAQDNPDSEADANAPAATATAPDLGPLSSEGQQTAKRLNASLAPGSEARAMFEAIMNGSQLGSDEGWFPMAVSQTLIDWTSARSLFDKDGDDRITAEEFSGPEQDFAALDQDGDGDVTETDLQWRHHALAFSPGAMFFRALDQDGNGKITAEETTAWFAKMDRESLGFLSLDDLRAAFPIPNMTPDETRPEHPSRETLLLALERQEIGSLQPGPYVNDPAPDFSLRTVDGTQTIKLSERIGQKPIVLIFGNITCGPFRGQAGNIEQLYRRYQDRADFLMIYVREAHPTGGWYMESNDRVDIKIDQPQDLETRTKVAARCQKHLGFEMPFLVDSFEDPVGVTYSGMPSRLYLIYTNGRVAFKSGRGPFGFKPRELEQALVLLLAQSAAASTGAP